MAARRGAWRDGFLVGVAAAGCVLGQARLGDPPRFDGAGYAVLARSLAEGRGYRAIDRPGAPRHAHFPPGYPLLLAAFWTATGPSAGVAHAVSAACTVLAVVAFWRAFRGMVPRRVALLLGLALAANWTWGRVGASIQSEPAFLLLSGLAVLAAQGAGRRGGVGRGLVVGLVLGLATLTRQVGAALAVAVGLELLLRRRSRAAIVAGAAAAAVVAPWVAWQAAVGRGTQAGLFPAGDLGRVVAGNALFYLRRLPDAITGPAVEVATVFGSGRLAGPATAGAVLAGAGIAWGWLRSLRAPRRRLAALVALSSLALLLAWPFTEAGRFLIPLVPFVLIGATEGLAPLARRARLRRPRAWAAGALLAATLLYSAYALASRRAAAEARSFADFDAACAWIARSGGRPGPVLTRHPGAVFWQTGRLGAEPLGEPEALAGQIERLGVAYLLVDPSPYAGAPPSPLERFVAGHPDRVARVWDGPVAVFAVRDAPAQGSGKPPLSGIRPLSGSGAGGFGGGAGAAARGASSGTSTR